MIPHALIPEIALLSRNIHHCASPNSFATTTTQGTGNNSADTRYCYRRYTPFMPYTVYTAHTYRHCTTRAIVCKWSYCAQHGNLSEPLSTDSGCARLSPPHECSHRAFEAISSHHQVVALSPHFLPSLYNFYIPSLLPQKGFVHSTLAIGSLNCQTAFPDFALANVSRDLSHILTAHDAATAATSRWSRRE
jgi:hypothetical protein